jgi:hypothetical protein
MSVDAVGIRPRQVRFDWSSTPAHWVPGDPTTTHIVNVLHLLLPAGERWFVDVYKDALPLIADDPALREQVRGFMGQEAVHSRAHAAVLDHLRERGIDSSAYTRWVDMLFERVLGDRPRLPKRLQRRWLVDRLSIIAAIEQMTAVLGAWIIDCSSALDQAGSDPVMLDLLRWHGAEEIEHRNVAFDVFQRAHGGYLRRAMGMLLVGPTMAVLWYRGARFLWRRDPALAGSRPPRLRDYSRVARHGLVPAPAAVVRAMGRYFKPSHSPEHEGSLESARAYLAGSPGALAARSVTS